MISKYIFVLLIIWGIPSTFFRSKFRKIVYQTDDWKINIKPLFVKELNYDNHIIHSILKKEVNINERI